MNRRQLINIAKRLARGSQPAARHTHIECFCPGYVHRRDDYDIGCFCPECASKAAVKLGYPPTDVEPEKEGTDDSPQWCEDCGRLITLRDSKVLIWGISANGALEALEHYESEFALKKGEPKTPDDWRRFLLLVDAIEEEHLPRVEAVVRRATTNTA